MRTGRECISSGKCSYGFTLVELLVVIAIIGLIAGMVAVRTTGVTRTAQLEWSICRLTQLDGELRSFARSRGHQASLEIALGTNRIVRVYGDSASDRTTLHLGEGIVLRRLYLPTRDASSGTGIVEYSSEGVSSTYAIEIQSVGKANRPIWMLFTGTTGQFERREKELEAVRLVRALETPGNDAR